MTFQYKKPRKKRPPVDIKRPDQTNAPLEGLAGYITDADGMKPADSQAEERLANAMHKNELVAGFQYNYVIGTQGMPGYKKLDFIVLTTDGRAKAISVKDNEFIHHGAGQLAEDAWEEQYIMQKLKEQQIYIDQVVSIDARDLETQELADKTVEALI